MMTSPKRKIALAVEYDGSCYHGWQRQINALSVQETLERGWFDLSQEKISLIGCSRTDTSVSARRHISHFLSSSPIPEDKIHLALNNKLPDSISVLAAKRVAPDFHARFQAKGKKYSYCLINANVRSALDRNKAAWLPGQLDFSAMKKSLKYFLGEHDFTSLMDQGSPSKRTVRKIYQLDLKRLKRDSLSGFEYRLEVIGDGFLYHMVRILMGTIVEIGQGKIKAADIPLFLAEKERINMGLTMPAEGLILEKVYYQEELFGQDAWPYEQGDENDK